MLDAESFLSLQRPSSLSFSRLSDRLYPPVLPVVLSER